MPERAEPALWRPLQKLGVGPTAGVHRPETWRVMSLGLRQPNCVLLGSLGHGVKVHRALLYPKTPPNPHPEHHPGTLVPLMPTPASLRTGPRPPPLQTPRGARGSPGAWPGPSQDPDGTCPKGPDPCGSVPGWDVRKEWEGGQRRGPVLPPKFHLKQAVAPPSHLARVSPPPPRRGWAASVSGGSGRGQWGGDSDGPGCEDASGPGGPGGPTDPGRTCRHAGR